MLIALVLLMTQAIIHEEHVHSISLNLPLRTGTSVNSKPIPDHQDITEGDVLDSMCFTRHLWFQVSRCWRERRAAPY